jgi:hypothetical protein
MQNGSVLCDVDLFPAKHGIDVRAQTGFIRQSQEELEGFIGDAIFRVIQEKTHCLGCHTFAAFGIIREKLSQMYVANFLIVDCEVLPRLPLGERRDLY